jgi:Polyketide cyclase / dehydrase and lipid transport
MMRRRITRNLLCFGVKRRTCQPILAILTLTGMVAFALAQPGSVAGAGTPSEEWHLESNGGNVVLYSRARSGSSIKEFKGVGDLDASTRVVHGVLDDVEAYTTFMPYTTECRILRREDAFSILTYQRLSPKICSDRDYTLRINQTSRPGGAGLIYMDKWGLANELGPAEKPHVLRVKVSEGSWLLEPTAPDKTRATYCIYTDSGGSLPAFLANSASAIGIRKVFAAVRKQMKLPKYSAN